MAYSLLTVHSSMCPRAAVAKTEKGFEPTVGEAGHDIVWVQTPQELIHQDARHGRIDAAALPINVDSADDREGRCFGVLGAARIPAGYGRASVSERDTWLN